jgi:hypothetical protein
MRRSKRGSVKALETDGHELEPTGSEMPTEGIERGGGGKRKRADRWQSPESGSSNGAQSEPSLSGEPGVEKPGQPT